MDRFRLTRTRRAVPFAMVVLILATVWVVRFWHSAQFGLYEDDISIIPLSLAMSVDERVQFVTHYISKFYGQGRPLHHSYIYLFIPFIWETTGIGLQGAYLLGYVFVAFNAALFYFLLRRLNAGAFSLIGGLAYALFSADTTQAYLTHAVGLQPALTFLFAGLHLYLSDRKWLAFLATAPILISYETPFLVFLGAPLLRAGPWDRNRLVELAKHALIMAVMLVAAFAVRVVQGEGRVATLSLRELISVPLLHMVQGPPVSLGTYALRPYQALRGLNLEIGLAALLATAGFLWVFSTVGGSPVATVRGWFEFLREPRRLFSEESPAARLARLAIAGLLMLAMAYPLTFTVRAYAISGRDTRVHFAAVVGAAIVVGVAGAAFRSLRESRSWLRLSNFALALLFGALVGFGFVVQQDYSRAWGYQKGFWQELYPMIQDAGDSTAILIEPSGLKDTRYIDANTWNLPEVLDEIHLFPGDWSQPPRVYRLIPGWASHIQAEDGMLRLDQTTVTSSGSFHRLVAPENTIFFSTASGRLTRLQSLADYGISIELRIPEEQTGPLLSSFPTGPSYALLFGQPYEGPSPLESR